MSINLLTAGQPTVALVLDHTADRAAGERIAKSFTIDCGIDVR